MINTPADWRQVYSDLAANMLTTEPQPQNHWQSLDVSNSRAHDVYELLNLNMEVLIPGKQHELANLLPTGLNLPWAEDHFQERITGMPSNPGKEYKNWPWYAGNVDQHRKSTPHGAQCSVWADSSAPCNCGSSQSSEPIFSHTYMERYWPVYAGREPGGINRGIRYEYGDLDDVIRLLERDPSTRQAYLPIFFPEDTGAVHGERVPCSLGYQFLVREGHLICWYFMRSCDLVRYLADDIYLTGRLMQHIQQKVSHLEDDHPSMLTMTVASLHAFRGDAFRLNQIAKGE